MNFSLSEQCAPEINETTVISIAISLILLAVSTFGVGLAVSRRLVTDPLELLGLAIALGLVFVYFGSFVSFLAPLWSREICFFLTAISAAVSIVNRSHYSGLFNDRDCKQAIVGYLLLSTWGIICLSVIRSYSGGFWELDWLEQYDRMLFFLNHLPLNYKFLNIYSLPARPPGNNLIAAYFATHIDKSYPTFQIVSVLLGALVVFPGSLLSRYFSRRLPNQTRLPLYLSFLACLNPMVMQNLTYSWSRAVTAFFVTLAVYFYFAAFTTSEAKKTAVAFVLFGMASTVHYSAIPIFILLALPLLARNEGPLGHKQALLPMLSGLCFLPWLIYSYLLYGSGDTFGSNTTALQAAGHSPTELLNIARDNFYYSIFPQISIVPQYQGFLNSGTSLVTREIAFTFYQRNIFGMFGITSGAILLWQILAQTTPLQPNWRACKEMVLWTYFVLGSIVLGIAVVGMVDRLGLAHICLLPLLVIGLARIVASINNLALIPKIIFYAGLIVDSYLGIWLHLFFENQILATRNFAAKQVLHLSFLADIWNTSIVSVGIGLALILVAFWLLTHRRIGRTSP